MNLPIKVTILSLLFSFLFPLSLSAKPVLEQIRSTGVVKLATREDAAPFGYLDSAGNLQGYCLDFFALLRNKLTQELKRDPIAIRLLKSRIANRFELVERGFADLECGPNTIRENLTIQVEFSTTFFITGTQFLVKRNQVDLFFLNINNDFADLSIGVMVNTSTEEFIARQYPQARLEKFQGVTGRMRGVQALQQGKIDAFVSDGILLRGEAAIQNLSSQAYPLIPRQPLTCDHYGMIIPQGDSQWRNFVNSVIESKEAEKLFAKWFIEIIPYEQVIESTCQQ